MKLLLTNNNRLSENGTVVAEYDAQDRLVRYKTTDYAYNKLGQLTQRVNDSAVTDYDYDVFGNLRQVTLASGDVIDYIIDPNNRRIGRKLNGQVTQKLLYLDQLNPIAELYENNAIKNLFIYAEKSNAPSAMERYDESGNLIGTYRIISNHLSSVVQVVDTADGSIVQAIEYDVWGNVLRDSNPNFQPFYFAGGLYDTDTKLTRFGARDYDASIGRWTAKDPIGFAGGLTSLYDYVGQDPVNWIDANGNQARRVSVPRQGFNSRGEFTGLRPANQRSPYPLELAPVLTRNRLQREHMQRLTQKMINEPRMEQLRDMIDALENITDHIQNQEAFDEFLDALKDEYDDLYDEFGEPGLCTMP